MACVKCGSSTEPEVYICENCIEEANSKFNIGSSVTFCPSILSFPDISGQAVLSVDSKVSPNTLELIGDVRAERSYINEIKFQIEDMSESNCKKLLKRFARTFLSMGLPMDLEEKGLPILTQGDLSLAQKMFMVTEGIEGTYPGISEIELYTLIGCMHYCLSKVECGAVTIAGIDYHLDRAGEYFDKALSLDQDSLVAWKNKAKVLLEKGENSEALECYDWILENLQIPSNDHSILLNKGICLNNSGSFDEATKCFNKVLDKNPANVEAWRRKGNIFAKSDRWGGAIQCYNEAVKHNPNREDVWIAMAETYIDHEKYKDASKCLDEVLKFNIWNTDAWYLQGIVFSKIGRWGAAVQCLNKALSINPSSIKAWKAKGDLLLTSNRNEEALNCYDGALNIQSKNLEILTSKAKALKSMGKFTEALSMLERTLTIQKDNAYIWYEVGDILQETGKAYKALKSFDKALEINPSLAEAYYKKGITLEKLRRYKEAARCYEEALKLDAKHEKARTAKKDVMLKMNER